MIIRGIYMAREMLEKVDLIWRKRKTVQDRQKSYADKRHMKLEFALNDMVFVNVSPLKNVMRFGNAWKLAWMFVALF